MFVNQCFMDIAQKKLQKKWLESLECNKKASTFASAFDKESR